MRRSAATLMLIASIALASTAGASATPVVVNVRIEGETETLFEGPVRTEGHAIKALSETEAHPCDGTNAGKHPTPGATPTAAAVDAMSIIGEPFDGRWFPGFHDYLISRWGPEETEHWGVFVDATFTAVGGCQVELPAGSRVLWGYNAAKLGAGARFLSLSTGGGALAADVPTATVEVGKPLTVTVQEYVSGKEGVEVAPVPVAGAEVSPVLTSAKGFQTTETANPASVLTGAGGTAPITFATAGWQRLKATLAGALRSNRLDVCVVAHAAETCPPLPDDQVRSVLPPEEPPVEEPPAKEPPVEEPPAKEPPQEAPRGGGGGETITPQQKAETLTTLPGPGASGVSGSITDVSSQQLKLGGLTLTPLDDRASALSYRGHWRAENEPLAWRGTVTVGSAGATLTVRLPAGRPVLIIRDVRHRARLLLSAGSRRQRLAIPASASAGSRVVVLPRRAHAGTLTLRILEGEVGIDGVAVTH